MLIINEDTLIHTDSSSDVIEHFGVKGMRWGIRRFGIERFSSKKSTPKKYAKNDNSYKARKSRILEKERLDKKGMTKSNQEKYDALTKKMWEADHYNKAKDFDRLRDERAKLVESKKK